MVWSCISSFWILSVDTWNNFVCSLKFSDLIELFFTHSAWIGKSLSYQVFCKYTIDITSLRLSIGTIRSDFFIVFSDRSFIKANPKFLERVDQECSSSFNLSFLISIFDSEIDGSSCLFGVFPAQKTRIQSPKVQKTCRRWGKTQNRIGIWPGRIAIKEILDTLFCVWEKSFSQLSSSRHISQY